jgi:hypothetical protein
MIGITFMDQAANLFDEAVFISIAFPCFACKSDDAEINIVQCDLESAGIGTIFFNGIYLANILLAIEFKGYRKRCGVHIIINAKNIPF